MTLCENESSISRRLDDEDDSDEYDKISCNEHSVVAFDSRFSRLSFQSGDSKKSYRRRVSFDNTLHKSYLSYTLRTANEGYHAMAASRLFMVTLDDCDDMASAAGVVRYAMNLVDTGDEVVVIGMHHGDTPTPKLLATQLLNCTLDAQQHEDKISITVEVVFGKNEHTLRSMIQMYEPTILIVGCRRKPKKSALFTPNNNVMIHHSLKQASVPVIFVQHPVVHEEPIQQQQQQQQQQPQRGHRRTLTALSSPLPETMLSADDFDGSPSLSCRLASAAGNERPSSLVSSTNLAAQLRRKFGMLKK